MQPRLTSAGATSSAATSKAIRGARGEAIERARLVHAPRGRRGFLLLLPIAACSVARVRLPVIALPLLLAAVASPAHAEEPARKKPVAIAMVCGLATALIPLGLGAS